MHFGKFQSRFFKAEAATLPGPRGSLERSEDAAFAQFKPYPGTAKPPLPALVLLAALENPESGLLIFDAQLRVVHATSLVPLLLGVVAEAPCNILPLLNLSTLDTASIAVAKERISAFPGRTSRPGAGLLRNRGGAPLRLTLRGLGPDYFAASFERISTESYAPPPPRPETVVRSSLSARGHLPVLDGVRALAILMVIIFHFCQWFGSGSATLIGKLAVWGQTGVDLFFVLSGFLITGILLDSKGQDHFLRNFYVRRILRIFPLYYATLLAVFVAGPLLHLCSWTPMGKSFWFWFYLQNIPVTFAPSLVSGPGHFWSLAVEEHYYVFWPLLVLMLNRSRLLKAVGIMIALSLFTRLVLIQYGTFYFTLARLDGLGIGSALAILAVSERGGLKSYVPWARRLLILLGTALIVTQLLVSGKGLPEIQIVKSTLIATIYACIMVLAVEGACAPGITKFLSGRILGSIGKYSYGMYVIHPFVLGWLRGLGLPYGVPGLILSVAVTYLAAWISWTLCEERFLRLKRYFSYSAVSPKAYRAAA